MVITDEHDHIISTPDDDAFDSENTSSDYIGDESHYDKAVALCATVARRKQKPVL